MPFPRKGESLGDEGGLIPVLEFRSKPSFRSGTPAIEVGISDAHVWSVEETVGLLSHRWRVVMQLQRVTPMFHVSDVRATVAWYESIGFSVLNTFEDEDGMTFAMLSYGDSQIMLNAGGRLSTEHRRDVDLYIRTDEVDRLYERLKDRIQIRSGLEETFYGYQLPATR